MAEIVNLRQVRKRKRRAEAARDAAANRAIHGRTGGEIGKERLTSKLEESRLEGHRRDRRSEPDADT